MTTEATAPAERAEELRREIRRHDRLYYNLDRPEITDGQYDLMMEQLRRMEADHPEVRDGDSPTRRVGGAAVAGHGQLRHPEPMLSLANAFDEAQTRDWFDRTRHHPASRNRLDIVAEPKIDGMAVRLNYEGGRLRAAATRGDGTTGEDVTLNVRAVRSVPLTLEQPLTLEVRGEIYMPKSAFERLNRERAEQGEDPYANPRNAAAGAMRQLDPAEAARRGLMFLAYSAHRAGEETHEGTMALLERAGVPTVGPRRRVSGMDEAREQHQELLKLREGLEFEIDGMVLKVNSLEAQELMGATGREPRWAIAWKYPSATAETRLLDITVSMGRFGRMTPVAVLEAVEVGGVTVTSATLHNEEDVRRKDIRKGDRVIVERAGDVIPQVTGPVDTRQGRGTPVFSMPPACPGCGGKAVVYEGESGHWCPDEGCPSKLGERLRHFVSKRCMDIEHAGPELCLRLVERGLVQGPEDLYQLTKEQLTTLDKVGERSAERLLESIEGSRERPLDRVLYSLGIFRLGREVSGLLAERYRSVAEVAELGEEQLAAIPGIGPKVARSVTQGMETERVKRTIEGLAAGGVRMEQPREDQDSEDRGESKSMGKLEGKTLVVTGKLETMTRTEVNELIRAHGGNAADSVTGKTDILVVGDKPGSKLGKAEKLGVTVMTERDFALMVNG